MQENYDALLKAIKQGNTEIAMSIIKVLEEEAANNPELQALLRVAAENGQIELKDGFYVPKQRKLSIVTYILEQYKED